MKKDELYTEEKVLTSRKQGFLIDLIPNLGPPLLPMVNSSISYSADPPPEMVSYDPPDYQNMFPDSNNPTVKSQEFRSAPASRKSKMTPSNFDDFELPDLPDVPDTLADLEADDHKMITAESNLDMHYVTAIYWTFGFMFFVVFAVIALLLLLNRKNIYKWKKKLNKKFINIPDNDEFSSLSGDKSDNLYKFEDASVTSGSGFGNPLLRETSLANEVKLVERITESSYKQVWKCSWRGEIHVCRIYGTLAQDAWKHESTLLQNVLHHRVVPFLGSDTLCSQAYSPPTFILLTKYNKNRSLRDFLPKNVIDERTMLSLMYTLASGLQYLHKEIVGNHGKPSIVHLNIKSSNIIVSDDGRSCLFSNFASACAYSNSKKIMESPSALRYNSENFRYFAPEILNFPDYSATSCEAAKAADVYSFALVLWEIATQCVIPKINEKANGPHYRLPYEEELHFQPPSLHSMQRIVCLDKKRPQIDNRWSYLPSLFSIRKLLNDSWSAQPMARLTTRRIMKDLETIKDQEKGFDCTYY